MTTQTIADAIQAAKQAAADLPASAAPAVHSAGGNAVSAYVEPAGNLGLDDMLGNGVAVDHWLKLSSDGIKVGDKTKPLDFIKVFLDMSEIAYSYQIKYQLNGSAKYHRTYNRQTESTGGSWAECIRQAQQIDPKAYEYRSAEIPLIAAEDIASKVAGELAAKAGERLGLTLSTTGWKPFQDFVNHVAKKLSADPKTAIIALTLGYEAKTKAGVNPWGVPKFIDAEEVDVLPVFDTIH
jgi:hypothetical protein